jgi:PPOX class probable F420-dependent enzyme
MAAMNDQATATGDVLDPSHRAFLSAARTATLVTIGADGVPRPVPICFVLDPQAPILYAPLDEKPKRTDDPRALARVRDIEARPVVAVLVDHWDEDWARLGWVRCAGRAALLEPGPGEHAAAVAALRARYQQYAGHRLEARPIIRIEIDRVTSWGAVDD